MCGMIFTNVDNDTGYQKLGNIYEYSFIVNFKQLMLSLCS